MINKIRVGIIGLGAIGDRLIPMFTSHPKIKITAVCDINEELARKLSSTLEGSSWYTDHQVMLEANQVDLVYIAVPPAFHESIALDVLKAKKHVLCEKPLANSVEEAKRMMEAAEQSGVVHAMHFPLNYSAPANKWLELLQEGYVGEIRRIGLQMHFPQWPRHWQQNAWVGGREQGGYILEVGSHFVQLILRGFGSIVEVQSDLQFPANPQACETGVIATMRLENGTPILVDGLSQIAGEEHLELTVYGSKGILSLQNWRELKGGKLGETVQELHTEDIEPPDGLIANLVLAIEGQKANLYDFRIGYEVQKVLEALRQPVSDSWQKLNK
jgi:predicted dehydrogenase